MTTAPRLAASVAIFAYYTLVPLVIDSGVANPLTIEPAIVLVGDFSPGGFGENVRLGILAAQESTTYGRLAPELLLVDINEQLTADARAESSSISLREEVAKMREGLITLLATRNVVAIISANSSQTAPAVVALAQTFRIPVLLTVATNAGVLSQGGGTAYRLLPTDRQQAAVIADWCLSHAESGPIGVLFDPNRYGIDLRDLLRKKLPPGHLMTFSMGTTTDVAGALRYGAQGGVSAWLVIGYQDQALEALEKKKLLGVPGDILLTDGAYGPWLESRDKSNHFLLAFPCTGPASQKPSNCTVPASNVDSKLPQLRGYAVFGYDAYQIAYAALESAVRDRRSKFDLAAEVPRVVRELTDRGRVISRYGFDESGENSLSAFAVYEVDDDFVP